jgi:hypothetical protein
LPRLWIAAVIAAIATLGLAPAAAQATVTASNITSWTSSAPGTPPNNPYLISYDNEGTTLSVTGTSNGTSNGPIHDHVAIVCYFGPSPSSQFATLISSVPVKPDGTFSTPTGTSTPTLKLLANPGRACRLRAVDVSATASGDTSAFAGPQLAVSETALISEISGGPNAGKPYNYYVNGVTFTGFAAWTAPGTPANRPAGTGACGGPYATPIDPTLNVDKSFPIDCAASLLSDDLSVWGGRSEVQVDGHNAYDAASAQALFARTGSNTYDGSEDLPGFPSISADVTWDPHSGLISSRAQESWVTCSPSDAFPPSAASCLSFADSGVRLTRVTTTGDGGRVVTLTDTWSSTDGRSHSVNLLYDDYVGVSGNADGERGWLLPGQSGFAQYTAGSSLPAASAAPASILTRTNVTARDGDPNEGFGAITFGQSPTGLRFAGPTELEENQLLSVPAGGSTSLSYVYSVGYSQADVSALALTAQDRFQPAAVQIASPADGTTVSTGSVTLAGIATAGSGIKSLLVGGQAIPVAPGGTWSAQLPLNPGANTITALATDGAGATAQSQVTVVYQPPATPAAVVTCHVPRVKGMRLAAAEKALRKAHCKVGKVKHVSSRKLARGRVMSTKPRAGRRLRAGTKIELFVSKGH